ncbi:MAG: tetratricopeptide repeat protein [Planctomycetales bacterium]
MAQHVAPDNSDDLRPLRWKRVMLSLCIVSFGIGAVVWWQPRPKAEDFLRRAQVLLQTSDFDSALTALEEAIRLGDDRATTRLLAGEAELRLGKRSEALAHFEKVDDTAGPESLAARLSSASVMIHLHQIGRAEDQLRRALSIDHSK